MRAQWWLVLGMVSACAPLAPPGPGSSSVQPPVSRVRGGAADAACPLEGAGCELPGGWPGQCCRGQCVGLNSTRHCGACGRDCGAGGTCYQGACITSACDGSSGACVIAGDGAVGACCGEACVDLASDARHCGACGRGCGAGTCAAGACVVDRCAGAPAGTRCQRGGASLGLCCGDTCVDDGEDGANCGGCGLVCPPATHCQSGLCLAQASQDARACSPGWTCVESAFGTQCGVSSCERATLPGPLSRGEETRHRVD